MDQDLTLEQMSEFLYGKQIRAQVMFFDGEVRDGLATEQQGKRVMIPAVMIRLQFPKENVDVTRYATPRDEEIYLTEYLHYLEAKKKQTVAAVRRQRRRKPQQAKAPVLNFPVNEKESATGT